MQTHPTKLLQLLTGVTVIAIVWCIALPRLSEQPRVKQRLDWLEAERIDPSVKFYTELERMEEILKRSEKRVPLGLR